MTDTSVSLSPVETALYSRLSGDATLVAATPGGIHNPIAPHTNLPSDVAFPVLTFQAMPTVDEFTMGDRTEILEYIFRAGAQGLDPSVIHDILNRVDVLLNGFALSITGFILLYLRRIGRGAPEEITEHGIIYLQGTARYRLEVQPS